MSGSTAELLFFFVGSKMGQYDGEFDECYASGIGFSQQARAGPNWQSRGRAQYVQKFRREKLHIKILKVLKKLFQEKKFDILFGVKGCISRAGREGQTYPTLLAFTPPQGHRAHARHATLRTARSRARALSGNRGWKFNIKLNSYALIDT